MGTDRISCLHRISCFSSSCSCVCSAVAPSGCFSKSKLSEDVAPSALTGKRLRVQTMLSHSCFPLFSQLPASDRFSFDFLSDSTLKFRCYINTHQPHKSGFQHFEMWLNLQQTCIKILFNQASTMTAM